MKQGKKYRIRRGIMATSAILSIFLLCGFMGGMDQDKLSIEMGVYGAIGCLLWFICASYLAGGFRKYVGREEDKEE